MKDSQQHPLLKVVQGADDAEESVTEWDARFELNVALLIRQLHASDPPSRPSVVSSDLLEWADLLEADGRLRLGDLGVAPLRPLREARQGGA